MKILIVALLSISLNLVCKGFEENLPNLTRVHFVTDRHGFAIGVLENETAIYVTEDGGRSWKNSYRVSGELLDITFADKDIGWAIGSRGIILKSVDSGMTWKRYPSGTKLSLYGIAALDKNNVWISGASGTILHSMDGGVKWLPIKVDTPGAITDIAFFDLNKGIATSYGTILSTSDGGRTWKPTSSGEWKQLMSVQLTMDSTGWIAVGPALLHTIDGGGSWSERIPLSQGQITGVDFVDSKKGWVVKSRGEVGSSVHIPGTDKLSSESFILFTSDGGESWKTVHHIESSKDLAAFANDIFFFDDKNGWVVGSEGLVLRTIDGGVSWQSYSWNLASVGVGIDCK